MTELPGFTTRAETPLSEARDEHLDHLAATAGKLGLPAADMACTAAERAALAARAAQWRDVYEPPPDRARRVVADADAEAEL